MRKARSACGFSTKIEVECTSESDAVEAAEVGGAFIPARTVLAR